MEGFGFISQTAFLPCGLTANPSSSLSSLPQPHENLCSLFLFCVDNIKVLYLYRRKKPEFLTQKCLSKTSAWGRLQVLCSALTCSMGSKRRQLEITLSLVADVLGWKHCRDKSCLRAAAGAGTREESAPSRWEMYEDKYLIPPSCSSQSGALQLPYTLHQLLASDPLGLKSASVALNQTLPLPMGTVLPPAP